MRADRLPDPAAGLYPVPHRQVPPIALYLAVKRIATARFPGSQVYHLITAKRLFWTKSILFNLWKIGGMDTTTTVAPALTDAPTGGS